jgi:hypothetical protein
VSDWKTEAPSETVAADRVGRWDLAVATLRSEKRLDFIDKSLRDRAFRLLRAIAREADDRGHLLRNHHPSLFWLTVKLIRSALRGSFVADFVSKASAT